MGDKIKQIRCISCKYAQQDKKISEYSIKHCSQCEVREDCDVCRDCKKRDGCIARINPKYMQRCTRRNNMACSQQELRWAAYQCANHDSEYFRALLNVRPNGDKQYRITWSGCERGERKVRL